MYHRSTYISLPAGQGGSLTPGNPLPNVMSGNNAWCGAQPLGES